MVFDTVNQLRAQFWDETFWTPPNTTWTLYEDAGYRYFNDIFYSLYTSAVLITIRLILTRLVYNPIGLICGLKATPRIPPPVPNAQLEAVFRKTKEKKCTLQNPQQLTALSKQFDISERYIQRWMRARLAQTCPTVLTKFSETCWRFTFYLVLFIYGLIILWNKPWMWNSLYCFLEYPHHTVSSEEWWYYNVESAFYIGLIFSQFFDVHRKDFWLMFVHHFITIILLSFSWACNLVRIGTLVLVIHDFADIPLEFGKLLAYLKLKHQADICLVVFALFWTVSRLIILPYRIIYYSSIVAPKLLPMFNAYYFFNGMLLMLQALHFVWTYYIVVAAINTMSNDTIRDMRSDDEFDDYDDDEEDEEDEEEFDIKLKQN